MWSSIVFDMLLRELQITWSVQWKTDFAVSRAPGQAIIFPTFEQQVIAKD